MNYRRKPQKFQNKLNTQQRCVNFVNHLDRIRVLAILCPVKSKVAAPRWHCLVPCRGPWFCSVLRCGAALFWWCRVVSFALAGAVCCCLWLPAFVTGSGCLLLFFAGVCCRACSCLAAWLAALLCAVVCFGAPLSCAVSCVLWCCVAVWCRAVAPCCPFSFAGGVGLCPFPVCAVLCCAARRVVWCRLVCAVVAASCCGVLLCVVVSPLAFCGVVVLLWCVVVSGCAVLCSVVLCRLVVLWCWAVLCVVPCCECSCFL